LDEDFSGVRIQQEGVGLNFFVAIHIQLDQLLRKSLLRVARWAGVGRSLRDNSEKLGDCPVPGHRLEPE
jgi:hypothetical protein